MAVTKISIAAAQAACDAIVDLLDSGAGTAYFRIYDGTPPADLSVAVTSQVLLAELDLSNPAFGAAADGNPGAVATANSITAEASAPAGGTAAWFRIFNRNGDAVIDGDVTATGGGGALELNSTTIGAGANVSISSWTFTVDET